MNDFPSIGAKVKDMGAAMTLMGSAARQAAHAAQVMARPLHRLTYTPGDYHVERVVKEILEGRPGRPAEIRLLCAIDMKEIIDRFNR